MLPARAVRAAALGVAAWKAFMLPARAVRVAALGVAARKAFALAARAVRVAALGAIASRAFALAATAVRVSALGVTASRASALFNTAEPVAIAGSGFSFFRGSLLRGRFDSCSVIGATVATCRCRARLASVRDLPASSPAEEGTGAGH